VVGNSKDETLALRAIELGHKLYEGDRLNEAEALFKRALSILPSNFDAIHFLGVIEIRRKSYDRAANYLIKAIELNPKSGDAYHHLGLCVLELGDIDAALKIFQRAVALKPTLPASYRGMGDIYSKKNQITEAVKQYHRALEFDPNSIKALNNLGNTLKAQGKLSEAVNCFRKARLLEPGRLDIMSNELMCLATDPNIAGEEYIKVAREYGRIAQSRCSPFTSWAVQSTQENKPLRIGFVSGDFRNHVVAKLIEGAIRELSKQSIELFAYHNNWRADDDVTLRMKPYFTSWTDINDLDDESLAKKIHSDSINILIDMSGHSAHNRLPVFAYKAAPVQISWMGFFASTGISEIDYFCTDKIASPERKSPQFTEEIWHLKNVQCLSPMNVKVERNPLESPYEKNGYFTFGCMNRLDKVSDKALGLWSNILRKISDSHLYINSSLFFDEEFKKTFIERLKKFTVPVDRVILASHDGSQQGYLSCFNKIDLVLDTFPYNGSTVNLESLWMGTPYVSKLGSTPISRSGGSYLHSMALNELIAKTSEEYVNKAVEVGMNPKLLNDIKHRIKNNTQSCGLFNAQVMAEQLKSDFTKMWKIYCEK